MNAFWKKWLTGATLLWIAVCFSDPALSQDADQREAAEPGAVQPGEIQEDSRADDQATTSQSAYQIGSGDVLDVVVYNEPDLTRLVTVQHGGEISFPLIGEVEVAGRTVKEVQELVEGLLAKDFLVDPQVTIRVKEYRSQWVTLVGEVARPDKYYLDGPTTLLDLLTEAGGFTPQASGEVILSRMSDAFENGENTRRIWLSPDMTSLEQKAALEMLLSPNDLVTVPAQAFFYISGEVKNPGSYPLTSGLTVLNAISLSGGLSKFGSTGKVEILRKNGNGKPERIKIDIKDIEQGKKPDLPLVAGDIVKVGKRVF